jgi:hypothetical protein
MSFGVTDCSYGGAFDPPLTDVSPLDGFCEVSGPRKALGTVVVDPLNPLEFLGATTLKVTQEQPTLPPGSPSLAQGAFDVIGGIVETFIIPQTSPGSIKIDAAGEIRNLGGIMFLTAPFDQLRLKARLSIILEGPNFGQPPFFPPSTLLQGDPVKLQTSKGNISVQNAAIVSLNNIMDFVAPKGVVSLHNMVIFVVPDGGATFGTCRFQTKGGVVLGLPPGDPTTILGCFPLVIKK